MDFSEKAEAVVAEGERQRGEYDPDPNSVPYRLYQYYLSRGGWTPERENFCHFWRVVVFWAPLFWAFEHTVQTRPVVAFFRFVGRVLAKPIRKWKSLPYGKRSKIKDGIGYVLFGLLTLVALGITIGALIAGFGEMGWILFLYIGGMLLGAVALIGFFVGIGLLFGRLTEKSRAARRAASDKAWEDYFMGDGPRPGSKVKKEPGRVKRFFKGLGDLLVLAVQVVRVNKWKICPLVNIEQP